MARSSPVVISDENPTAEQRGAKRQNEPGHRGSKGASPLAEQPYGERNHHRDTKYKTLKRAGIYQDGHAQRHQDGIARAPEMANPGQRSQNERASYGGNRAAPV